MPCRAAPSEQCPESFNTRLRDELLNGEIFYSLREEAKTPPGLMPHSRTDHQHVCARIRRAAGFATSTGSAGHAGTTASSKLTFHPVPSMKAGQSAPSSAPRRRESSVEEDSPRRVVD